MGAITGFVNAPVTKAYCFIVAGASLLTSYLKLGKHVTLDMPKVLRGEVWRLLTSQIVFLEHPQTFLGAFLLYTFRHIERQMGSRKFGSFLVITTVIATTFEVVASMLFEIIPASGPFGVIYSLFVLFYATVPKIYPRLMGFLGVDFSDKSLYYAVGTQLLFGGSWQSALSACCGLMAGALYRTEALPLQKIKLPAFLCRCLSIFGPLLNTRRPTGRPRGQGGARQNGGAGMREQLIPGGGGGTAAMAHRGGAPRPAPPAQSPSEEAIQTLMSLGFERGAVIRALQSSGNNVEVAANRLLTGGG